MFDFGQEGDRSPKVFLDPTTGEVTNHPDHGNG
jgi:hypothetical protein